VKAATSVETTAMKITATATVIKLLVELLMIGIAVVMESVGMIAAVVMESVGMIAVIVMKLTLRM
jgi:hypothetical protein